MKRLFILASLICLPIFASEPSLTTLEATLEDFAVVVKSASNIVSLQTEYLEAMNDLLSCYSNRAKSQDCSVLKANAAIKKEALDQAFKKYEHLKQKNKTNS